MIKYIYRNKKTGQKIRADRKIPNYKEKGLELLQELANTKMSPKKTVRKTKKK